MSKTFEGEFRVFVNGNYLLNTYSRETLDMMVAQLRAYGWSILEDPENPMDVYIYSSPQKIAKEYITTA